MKNIIKYVILTCTILLIQEGCTEIYDPDISASDVTALVVEGLITNGKGPFHVKLSLAKPMPYNSENGSNFIVRGAKLTIVDSKGGTYQLTEKIPGDYVLPDYFKSETGVSYQLQIATKDGKQYESTFQKLLPAQNYDSVSVRYAMEDFINNQNKLKQVRGADLRVDLFQHIRPDESIISCRFKSNLALQYYYIYRDRDINGNEIMSYHWVVFGWEKFNLNAVENLTEKMTASDPAIKNHPIGFIPFDAISYGYVIPPPKLIYFIRVSQYTLNNDAYKFYKSANEQLSTKGNLFDPITSQVYGNLKCVNDPEKIVLGLFEVSGVSEHAFLLENLNLNKKEVYVSPAPVMEIPADNEYTYRVWDDMSPDPVNDETYIPIPLPSWWNHK